MSSSVLDPAVAVALDLVSSGLDALSEVEVEPVDAKDAVRLIRETERLARRVQAVQIDVLSAIERRGLHRGDGHASAKVMVRHVANLSDAEALRRARTARALRDLPAVASAFRDGGIGRCQSDVIARAHANPRVRAKLIDHDTALAGAAAKPYRFFERHLADWVRRTDEDGTCDQSERNHENRDAKLIDDLDGSWNFSAGCGSLQGAELHAIFQKFIEAEWLTDWEKAKAEHGEAATTSDLARTDNQRRFDAFFQIFQRAATSRCAEGGSKVVTNIVIDQATFERTLRRMTGTAPDTADISLGDDRPGRVGYRCSTIDGHVIDPTEAVADALIGHVRRVVIGADSTVIDLSRRRRLFTGAAALAVKLATTECYWPGCHVPVSDCQIDHLIPWADHGGGSTRPDNGGPACGKHNRHKEHGYTAWRDQGGQWHVQRPDGTEID